MLSDLADIAMGSIWMLLERHLMFDTTSYFDIQCTTFLVPKPHIVNAAEYIYLCMSWQVWALVLISFCTISITLTTLSRANAYLLIAAANENRVYHNLNRSFLDILLILSGHGVKRFYQSSAINCLLLW